MMIIDTVLAYRSPLTLLLVLFGPTVLPRALNYTLRRLRGQHAHPNPSSPRPELSTPLKVFLAVHTLVLLYKLTFPPFDLFVSNRLPIFTPNAILRNVLLGPSNAGDVSDPAASRPLEELLLQRLQNADNRYSYARFGHKPLLECVWCQTPVDFLIYSVPLVLAPYVGEAVLLGLIGWRSIGGPDAGLRAAEWRTAAGAGLGGMAVADLAARYFWDLSPNKGDCLHLASAIYTLRCIGLLLLPLIYTYLPLPSPSQDISTLIPTLVNTQNTVRLSKLTRTAIKRDPRFRRFWIASGEEEARQQDRMQQALYGDHEVREARDAAGIDLDVARAGAKRWAREGWQSLVKVEQ